MEDDPYFGSVVGALLIGGISILAILFIGVGLLVRHLLS